MAKKTNPIPPDLRPSAGIFYGLLITLACVVVIAVGCFLATR